jgi:hypothetical protein
MRLTLFVLAVFAVQGFSADLQTGPPLPYKVVKDWGQLPQGWTLGETSGVDVDKNDNVWVFNRGKHPVIQFDKNGKMLQAGTTSRSSLRTAYASILKATSGR